MDDSDHSEVFSLIFEAEAQALHHCFILVRDPIRDCDLDKLLRAQKIVTDLFHA